MASKYSRKDKLIHLVTILHGIDENDNPIEVQAERPVFAAEKSIRDREFYAAASYDMRPEITYVVWAREYKGEQHIAVGKVEDDQQYQLIRTYKPNPEEIELTCSGPGPRPRTR